MTADFSDVDNHLENTSTWTQFNEDLEIMSSMVSGDTRDPVILAEINVLEKLIRHSFPHVYLEMIGSRSLNSALPSSDIDMFIDSDVVTGSRKVPMKGTIPEILQRVRWSLDAYAKQPYLFLTSDSVSDYGEIAAQKELRIGNMYAVYISECVNKMPASPIIGLSTAKGLKVEITNSFAGYLNTQLQKAFGKVQPNYPKAVCLIRLMLIERWQNGLGYKKR